MAAVTQNDFPAFEPRMRKPLTFSVVFHAVVVLIAVVGLPYMKPELPAIDTSITVELVDVGKRPKSEAPENIVRPPPPRQVKEDKPPAPVPAMPKVTASKPPKPIAPTPPEKAEEFTVPEEKTPEPAEKPQPVKAQVPEKKPERKPVLTQAEEQPDEPFRGLLRNLMDSEPVPQSSETPAEGTAQPAYSQMEINQLSARINQQLTRCWKLLYGARYAEDLVVQLKLFMNPDGSVRDARVVEQLRYNTDSFYRAATDAALRAVFNPQCNPLDLPYHQYNLWKVINANFDPSQML